MSIYKMMMIFPSPRINPEVHYAIKMLTCAAVYKHRDFYFSSHTSLTFIRVLTYNNYSVNMKIAIFVVACMVAVIAARPNEEKYTNKFDNIDLDKILSNNRLLNSYFKCLMEEGSCTAEGTTLKDILPDALATECAKCSDKQKAGAKKMIQYVVKNKPEMWQKLMDKYDPTKEYRVKFENEAKKEGIEINASK